MNELLSLFRLSLNSYFGLTALRIKYLHKREKLWEPMLVLLGVVAGGMSFGSMFYFLALTMAQGAHMVGQADFVLTQFIMLAQIMAFTFGLFAMISIFYFSNDLDILVPLPLKAWQILATKFSLVNIVEYAPVIVILMPTLIAYNQVVTLGLGGWFTAAATMLFFHAVLADHTSSTGRHISCHRYARCQSPPPRYTYGNREPGVTWHYFLLAVPLYCQHDWADSGRRFNNEPH